MKLMIGNGAVMGFTPAEVRAMSLWEYGAVIAGYNRSQGGEPKVTPPSFEKLKQQVAASKLRDEKAAAEKKVLNATT